LALVDLALDGGDDSVVMGAEVEVGQVNDAGHGRSTAVVLNLFPPLHFPTPTALTHGRVTAMDRTTANTGTREVAERLRFDEARLPSGWAHVPGFQGR
jgi:hypothetical protein